MFDLPECEVCPRQGNKLACQLYSCQSRRLHDYQVIKNWYKTWLDKKYCMACEYHKTIEDRDEGCILCTLRGNLIPLKQTCSKFKPRPWDPKWMMQKEKKDEET